MNVDNIMRTIISAFSARFDVRERRGGLEVITPYLLHDGTPLRLQVKDAGDGYLLSDDGQLVEYLELSGVDFDNTRIWSTWELLRNRANSAGDAYMLRSEVEDWELAAHCSRDGLGVLFSHVAAIGMQIDGLHHLAHVKAQQRRKPFRKEALDYLQEHLSKSIHILPDYQIPTKGLENQRVWAALTDSSESKVIYLEAVGASDPAGDVNRAMATYAISSTTWDERAVIRANDLDHDSDDIKRMEVMAEVVEMTDAPSLRSRVVTPTLEQSKAFG